MKPLPRDIAELLLDRRAVLLRPGEPFRFASGILSPIYCDNRKLLSDVEARRMVLEGFVESTPKGVTCVAGTATAGIAWGAWLAERLGLPFVYVRGEAKGHGTGSRIEGVLDPGAKVALIEDLVSTGGSVLAAARALKDSDARVLTVMCIFTYLFKDTAGSFEADGLSLCSLTTIDVLLDVAVGKGVLTGEKRSMVEAWREDPRNWPEAFQGAATAHKI